MDVLDNYRLQINEIDEEIIKLILERNKVSKNIGKLKLKLNLPITNKVREKEVLNRIRKLAKKNNLDEKSINLIYKNIIKQSKLEQKKIK